jgi:LysM repeat protein
MMHRDEEAETQSKHLPGAGTEPAAPVEPAAVPEYLEGTRRARHQTRPILRTGPMRPQSSPRPLQISSGTRRIPSYPDWEKPPSAFDYPRLRGQEVHRPLKPLLIVAVGVALIASLILAYSALSGHGGVAVASGSGRPSSSLASGAAGSGSGIPGGSASNSVVPSQPDGTPTPQTSFKQYQVKAGDSASKIANKFGLKTWELLAANPQLTPPNYNVLVGSFVNVPLPGQMAVPTVTPTPAPTATPSPTIAAP